MSPPLTNRSGDAHAGQRRGHDQTDDRTGHGEQRNAERTVKIGGEGPPEDPGGEGRQGCRRSLAHQGPGHRDERRDQKQIRSPRHARDEHQAHQRHPGPGAPPAAGRTRTARQEPGRQPDTGERQRPDDDQERPRRSDPGPRRRSGGDQQAPRGLGQQTGAHRCRDRHRQAGERRSRGWRSGEAARRDHRAEERQGPEHVAQRNRPACHEAPGHVEEHDVVGRPDRVGAGPFGEGAHGGQGVATPGARGSPGTSARDRRAACGTAHRHR